MALKVERTCDFLKSEVSGEHEASHTAEAVVGGMTMTMDVCETDLPALTRALTGLGFKPSRARVGKDTREAYVTASGQPFTSKQARNWLVHTMGRQMAANGRLSIEDLRAYAETH